MPLVDDSRPKPKHRKSTCAGCRRRKSKCDGKTPKCTTCIAYKDDCQYDKPPSLAYVRSLEEEIFELKSQLRQVKTQAWLSRTAHTEEKKPPSPSPTSDAAVSHHPRSLDGFAHRNRHVKWETDISLDVHGGISFHNPTSAVHESPLDGSHLLLGHRTLSSSHHSPRDDQQLKHDLMLNANHQRQIEHYAIANSAVKINVPKGTSMELLKYHWSWIHPLFLFVYRPAFIRSMAMIDDDSRETEEPPYFSDTLLKVMHAHSSRFLNHNVYQHQYQTSMTTTSSAQDFMHRMADEARYGLAMDMLKPSAIPTIQALLQQSTREVTSGNASQAWTFAGAGFRMALDLGIHLPSDKLQAIDQSLTAEDVEVRKRLFWSCYTWDKILSLYLGRMPGFTPATDDIPLTFMDEYSETDLWVPYYGETPQPDNDDAPNYPPCPGYVVSCFRQLCKLCVILNDLMQEIYSPEAAARREDEDHSNTMNTSIEKPFIRIASDLQEWLISLQPHLRISLDQMPLVAPPVHIVSLNLLYYTTVILLHRPVVLSAQDPSLPGPHRSYQLCLQATAAIHDLLLLASNTFGLSHISYLNAYSAYIAATIAVLRFERDYRVEDDHSTSAKRTGLFFLLEVLDRSTSSMPVLERSSTIIRNRMRGILSRQSENLSQSNIPVSSGPPYAAPTNREINLRAGTFPQIPQQNALRSRSQPNLSGGFVSPEHWQSGLRSSLYSEPNSMMDEFPPAFPSQRFPAESEHSYESSEIDSAQGALLGYNLDPHPRISAGGMDWPLMGSFEGVVSQIHPT